MKRIGIELFCSKIGNADIHQNISISANKNNISKTITYIGIKTYENNSKLIAIQAELQ